jgi:arylsulfatase A-like enzyme
MKTPRSATRVIGEGFRAVRLRLGAVRLLVGVASLLLAVGCGADPSPRSIIVITLDTTRADALSCYGFPAATTPVIDAIAQRGVLFEQAFAPMSQTLPSHASLFTGQTPRIHGALENQLRLNDRVQTLAELLAARGYVTAGFVGSRVLDEETGIHRGFQTFDQPERGAKGDLAGPTERSAEKVTDAALAWAAGQGEDGPRLVWVHYFDAHQPYEPVAQDIPLEPITGWLQQGPAIAAPPLGKRATYWHDYVNEIHVIDGQLGRLLAGLESSPWMRDAVVVIVGDHGEGFFEHGDNSHGIQITQEHVRVPLIIAAPDGELAGTRIAQATRVSDVLPTVVALAGVGITPAVEGENLLPELRGERAPRSRPLVVERPFYPEQRFKERFGPKGEVFGELTAVVADGLKLVRQPGGSQQLFDLAKDPLERHDLAAARPGDVARCAQILDEWFAKHPLGDVEASTISAEREQALEQLGY